MNAVSTAAYRWPPVTTADPLIGTRTFRQLMTLTVPGVPP